ncbi:BTAD domain-containing putative transcriptional regulator [Dactylosporangium sp. CA-092794]|uniref:BTAD domain-containing putative transcriptional regulator n=1 Tax=Dactylosporangium sp. CA-092794 TaxID=3239929 RepID=UPI003D8D4E75
MLASQPGRVVSVQRLIDELWADEPPERAISSLQAYVSRLRRALEPGRTARDRSAVLVSRAPGYVLQVPAEAVDANRFAAAVERATAELPTDPAAALRTLDGALALWRGDPLPELGESPLARAERSRLSELRLTATERHFDALLALGREAEVVYRSEGALAETPYRERLWAQLMLALYRSGRQADAMAAYARARAGLIDELGIEPGPALQQLAQDILRQAPHLASPPATPPGSAPPAPGRAVPTAVTDISDLSAPDDADGLRGAAPRPDGAGARPGDGVPLHDDRAARHEGAVPRREGAAAGPSDAGARPGDAGARPERAAARPERAAARSDDAGARSDDAGARSDDAGARSDDAGARPGDGTARSSDAAASVPGATIARSLQAAANSGDISEISEMSPERDGVELVGRGEELRIVDRLVAEVAGGRGRLLLVSGSPGIGKSALLREVAARAPGPVGTGTGVDGEAPPVFLPWAQILRGIATSGEAAAAALAGAFAPYGNLPAVLDPTLGEILPLPAAERMADPEMARSRLYQGIVDGLCRLAAHAPLVLVVDDAHWLDAPSTVLLTMFAKALPRSRVLLAVGYREAELAPEAPLAGVLAELVADPAAVRLPLHGLGPDGIAALAGSVTGGGVPDETVAMLADRTGGNPFFVVELLRVLVAEHTLSPEHVPVRVQEVLRRRLARLPGQVNAVLAVASVLGRDVAVPVLREVVQIDELALFDTLDTAVVAGLLTATDDPGLLRFSHDLVRQTAYQDQGPLRRARLHARAAQALRDTGMGTAAQLAGHLRAALPVLSPFDVVPGLAEAAGEAYDRTAHEQASALLEEALEVLHRAPATERRDVAELDLRIRLAYMHQATDGYLAPFVAGQYAAMEPLLLRLRGRPVLDVLPALWGYASFHTAMGDVRRAVSVARSPADRGGADPWAVLVAEVHAGHAALTVLDLPRAHRCFTAALAAVPGGEQPIFPIVNWDPIVGAHAPAAIACGLLGDDAAAQAHLRSARERAEQVGEPFLHMYIANFVAAAAADRDDPVAAAGAASETLAYAERGGHPEYRSLASLVLGWTEVRAGAPAGLERMTAARDHLGVAMRRFGRLEALYADALLTLGHAERAAAAAGAALERGLPGQSGFAEPDLRRLRALARRDPACAREALELARKLHHAPATARCEAALATLSR